MGSRPTIRFLACAALVAISLVATACSMAPGVPSATDSRTAGATTSPSPQSSASSPPSVATAPAAPKPAPTVTKPAPAPVRRPIPGLVTARVIRVVDGDTAVFSIGGRQEKTRFIGVNTPESTTEHEPYGEEASRYTKRVLTVGRKVHLEYDAELRDRYGRLLAYVWLVAPTARTDAQLRSRQFNARLLLEGYAQQMTIQPNSRYADYYTVYAREARQHDRGLWGLPLTSSSSSGGSASSAGSSGGYIGSKKSDKFHYRSCYWGQQIKSWNLIVFKTRAAALAAGYVPCKVCKP